MNDESSGINNTVLEIEIEVTALGVRVIPLDGEGNIPTSEEDRQQAAINVFDVRNETEINIPISIRNEGTGTEMVTLSYTNVQEKHPVFNYFISPEDNWQREYLKLDLTNFRRKVNRVMTFKFPQFSTILMQIWMILTIQDMPVLVPSVRC